MSFNQNKMRELILYLAQAEKGDYTFGRVKLAKLLYYADMSAYVLLGAPITGATYMKRKEGPAAREFVPLRDQMLGIGDAREVPTNYPNGHVGQRLEALRDPNIDLFDEKELKIADEVVERYRGWSGTQLSIESHKEIGWRVADMDAVIPYQHFYLAPSVSRAEYEKALEVAVKLNLGNAA